MSRSAAPIDSSLSKCTCVDVQISRGESLSAHVYSQNLWSNVAGNIVDVYLWASLGCGIMMVVATLKTRMRSESTMETTGRVRNCDDCPHCRPSALPRELDHWTGLYCLSSVHLAAPWLQRRSVVPTLCRGAARFAYLRARIPPRVNDPITSRVRDWWWWFRELTSHHHRACVLVSRRPHM